MFKIIMILFLLLFLGGTITRRALRIVAIAALILLLVRELRFIDVSYVSFSTMNGGASQRFGFSDTEQQDILISDSADFTLTSVFGGTIKIVAWDESFIRVNYIKKAANEVDLKNIRINVKTDVSQEGVLTKQINIIGDAEGSTWSTSDGWFSIMWSRSNWVGPVVPCVDYELFIPRKKMAAMKVNLREGQVDVQSLTVSEGLSIHVHNGAVSVKELNGDVHIQSRSGNISLADIRGAVSVDARSGVVDIEQVQGKVSVENRSGALQFAAIAGDVVAETRSGVISMKNVAGNAQAKTRSGAIVLDDATGSVNVSTGSGSVTITQAPNARGAVRASSRSGHILVRDSNGDIVAEGRGQIVIK